MTFTDKLNSMIHSRRFRASMIGIIVIALQDLLNVSEEQITRLTEIAAVWIAGDTISKTGLIFGSRRFYFAIASAGLVFAQPYLGISCEQVTGIARFLEFLIISDAGFKMGEARGIFSSAFVK